MERDKCVPQIRCFRRRRRSGCQYRCSDLWGFLNFNPHLHAIVTDGCFLDDDDFKPAPDFILENLEDIFRHEVLKMLKKEGKINDTIIENMLSWRHSGFHVHIGDSINHETDPLVCPKCQGAMRIIGFIEDFDIIKRILHHLDLLDVRNHDPPQKFTHYFHELVCGETDAQVPLFDE